MTELGLNRPQATTQCTTLLLSLVNEVGLTMFPDYGTDPFARKDIFNEVPRDNIGPILQPYHGQSMAIAAAVWCTTEQVPGWFLRLEVAK